MQQEILPIRLMIAMETDARDPLMMVIHCWVQICRVALGGEQDALSVIEGLMFHRFNSRPHYPLTHEFPICCQLPTWHRPTDGGHIFVRNATAPADGINETLVAPICNFCRGAIQYRQKVRPLWA